jgi:hypothetical protein
MRGAFVLFCTWVVFPPAHAAEDLGPVLERLAEEAAAFRYLAPRMLAEESLEQTALLPAPRFRPRIGPGAAAPLKPETRTKRVVSEYTYAAFREAPDALHEMRQVVTVDGRKIRTTEKARETLTLGATSADDKLRKQMLQELRKYGLMETAVDFGQIILLFSKPGLGNFRFEAAGRTNIGAGSVLAVRFDQLQGDAALLSFEERRAVRRRLRGTIWVQEPGYLPVRIMVVTSYVNNGETIRDEGTVEYGATPFGALAPVSVVHRRFADERQLVENAFRYSTFRKFGADSEIKFTEVPEPPK